MSALLRVATAIPRVAIARPAAAAFTKRATLAAPALLKNVRQYSSHDDESYEEFTQRFNKEFEEAYDLYEVQRVLNNVFSYDLVPAPETLLRALQACRRVNDYPTAVRVFEGLKVKVENKQQYQQYLDELKDVRQELGVDLAEDL
ncbi:hypothetical protein DV451_001300 [Geotrichum candidum]|uniref:Cytochrome c oxidase subunit 6, mitochondrial n=1 Tax=Geotrichum candidum TaxID=1173061 RepID=A0A0J9X695_GEOCN|nr:hypothetical protein DV451_001300 [Geotrichum candidum]KAI9212266.1 hypothetical protein DS838_002851 [Geotrichum bryndzae]KAF5109216.1 hypothetical protein DV453_001640 [Geotrichum candidum]KAF5112933.1 hypothetical protein DV452_003851 [Geotrichum candidum]KAF5117238.1 hypothetical protein DV454_001232 [Geotrichum candidum]